MFGLSYEPDDQTAIGLALEGTEIPEYIECGLEHVDRTPELQNALDQASNAALTYRKTLEQLRTELARVGA